MPPARTLLVLGLVAFAAGSRVSLQTAPAEASYSGGTTATGSKPGAARQRSSDSMVVVSAKEHALVMQDPATGARTAFFRVGLSPDSVAITEDGRTAVVTNRGDQLSGNSICIVDLHATNLVRTIPLEVTRQNPDQSITTRSYHRPSGIAFIPGKKRVVVSCEVEGALLLVDLVEARVIGDCLLEANGSNAVVVDHSGRFAFVANRDSGTVSVVKLDRMRLVKSIEAGGGPAGMALHPVRNEIWLANTQTNSISVIDVDEQEERLEFACGAMPSDIDFTPDGKYALVVNMQEGNISVFNSESRRIRTLVDLERVTREQALARPVTMPGHFGRSPLPTRILMGPDGKHAYVATRRSDQLHEIDLSTWKVVRTMPTATAPTDLGWSRVGMEHQLETSSVVETSEARSAGEKKPR
ncbi:YncE family protein [Saltatorellus ferox]|uniref:YncE family protein n=1 Tax=Saltatorellus ferox TaxID=2528018 RepID=UPI003AF334C1